MLPSMLTPLPTSTESCFSAFKVGTDPLLTSAATTLPSTTCESKTAVKVSTSRSSTPFTSKVANKASKAALVGANTVKGPSALSGVIELLQQSLKGGIGGSKHG